MATVHAEHRFKSQVAEDDGVREQHGFAVGDKRIIVQESGDRVWLDATYNAHPMTPRQARYLARKLYRLARRIEKRELPA